MAIVKKNNDLIFRFISYILLLAGRLPLYYVIGQEGMAYYAIGAELTLLAGGVVGYGLKEACTVLIRYRTRREQYKNAGKIFHGALVLAFAAGLVFMVLLQLGCQWFVGEVLALPLAVMGVRMALLAVPFLTVAGVFCGYFQGYGMRAPGVHADFIFAVVFTVSACIGGAWWMDYGDKVAGLLHEERFRYVYGAVGAGAGLVIASFFSFFYLLILYLVFRRSLEKTGTREYARNQEGKAQVYRAIFGSGGFYVLFYLVFYSAVPIKEVLYFAMKKDMEQAVVRYGMYYAGCEILILSLILLFGAFFYMAVRKIAYFKEREDYRMARERLGILIHHGTAVVMMTAVLTAVLSEELLGMMLGKQGEGLAAALQTGCVCVVFGTFAVFMVVLLLRMQRGTLVVAMGGAASVLQMILTVVLLKLPIDGILALAFGTLGFYLILAAGGFVFVSHELQYRQDWIRQVAVPSAVAAIAGVLVLLLKKALLPAVGRELTVLICLILGICMDLLLLFLSRNLREEELSGSVSGRVVLRLGQLLRFF